MAWQKQSSVSLSVAGDNLSTGTITAKKFMQLLTHIFPSGVVDFEETFNNDTTTYASRQSDDGVADGTLVTQANIDIHVDDDDDLFVVQEIINISDEEKLVISHSVSRNTAGAGTAPSRREQVAKHDNTVSQITEVDIDNALAAVNYNTDSNITSPGTN